MSEADRGDAGSSVGAGKLLRIVLLLIIHLFMVFAIFPETSAFF